MPPKKTFFGGIFMPNRGESLICRMILEELFGVLEQTKIGFGYDFVFF